MKTRILSIDDLSQYLEGDTMPSLLNALYRHQRQNWKLFQQGISALSSVKERAIQWYQDKVIIQHNPARIVSVTANTDPSVIRKRSCFLCIENLPEQQTAILIYPNYLALCNPMPIFDHHFTVAFIEHIPQNIVGNIEVMLQIAKTLMGRYILFFNGALCGASAPDHLHFQCIPTGTLPLFNAIFEQGDSLTSIGKILSTHVYKLHYFGVRYVYIKGAEIEDLVALIERLIYLIDSNHPCGKDLVNILSIYDKPTWHVIIIPREKHRPDCYYEEENSAILVSPGAVEMAGVIVTPRESDFQTLSAEQIESILKEVTLNTNAYTKVLELLFKT